MLSRRPSCCSLPRIGVVAMSYVLLICGLQSLAESAKVARYLPTPAQASVKVVAGQQKVLVITPDDRGVTRFDLATGEREGGAGKLAFDGTFRTAAMGSASAGPLLVYSGVAPPKNTTIFKPAEASFFDPLTFRKIAIDGAFDPRYQVSSIGEDTMHVRASADGRTFGI